MADPLLQLMEAAIRDPDPPCESSDAWTGLVERLELGAADREAMLGAPRHRLGVYRKLVHNRMANAIREFIPRTATLLGQPRLRADVGAFIAARASRSPYLRDVPAEFVQWAVPSWQDDRNLPPYVSDLARHELLEFDVRNDPRGGEPSTGLPIDLEAPLVFEGSARLMRYDFAVHRLPEELDTEDVPAPETTHLLVYRDGRHRVRYLELTSFAHALLGLLIDEALPVGEALQRTCTRRGDALDDEQLAMAARLLADLAERDVMRGARPKVV